MKKQKTVKNPVCLEGVGLQTGKKVSLRLKSSPAGSGINFIRMDLPNKPLLNVRSINFAPGGPERRTTLGHGPLEVQTTEHILAALSGLSIDNIVAEIDAPELPGLDGSALGFVEAIKKAGVAEQDAPSGAFEVKAPIWCEAKGSFLAVFPSEEFRISYTLSYDNPAIGTQFLSIAVDEKSFISQIAPARTFCLTAEALILRVMGMGKGANFENALVMGKRGPVKNALRFPDEPVRHKILDAIGDLYMLGMPIKGHVVGIKSGHALNMEMVRRLKEEKQWVNANRRY